MTKPRKPGALEEVLQITEERCAGVPLRLLHPETRNLLLVLRAANRDRERLRLQAPLIEAALKENNCRCYRFDCKHLMNLFDETENFAAAIKSSRRGK